MNIKKLMAAFCAAISMITVGSSYLSETISIAADENDSETHTVTFLDFDGNVINVQEIEHNGVIDYSQIDTSQLDKHIDTYTEKRFHAWDKTPKTAESDITIQALSETGIIELTSLPNRRNYFSNKGNISLKGLAVSITIIVETPEFDKNGNRKTTKNVYNVSESCYTKPDNLSEAFKNGKDANILLYPAGSELAIADFNIRYMDRLGDVLLDGAIDANDASYILMYYAAKASGKTYNLSKEQLENADVDQNGVIDAMDASYVLVFYSMKATNRNPIWDNIITY